MLIIAISYLDQISFKCKAERSEADPEDVDSVMSYVLSNSDFDKESIDEIFVIENDEVIASFSYEDGLGEHYPLDEESFDDVESEYEDIDFDNEGD
jgi:hypothetical protein